MITIYYFAGLKEITGKSDEKIPSSASVMTVQDLLNWASKEYEGFTQDIIHVAVNEEYALPEDTIRSGDVVAFIPPVSGG